MVQFSETRYTVREFAALLGCSTKTVRRYLDPKTAPQGIALTPLWIGGRLFITLANFVEWQHQQDVRRARLRQMKQRYRRTITC